MAGVRYLIRPLFGLNLLNLIRNNIMRLILCQVILSPMLCCLILGCGSFRDRFLKAAPSKDEIIGMWILDIERTNWSEVKYPPKGRSTYSLESRLAIRKDGSFKTYRLPNYLNGEFLPWENDSSDSGQWIISQGENGFIPNLNLVYDIKVHSDTVRKGAYAFFRKDGGEILLYFFINDYENDIYIVFRKSMEE